MARRENVNSQAPEGWKLEVSGNTVSAGSISGEGLTINFSLDEQGKTGAQKALDDAVRADCASFPEGNAVAVQEMKTKSGHGAYAVFTTEGPLVAMHPTYIQMLFCRFMTGDVIVKVWGVTTNEMQSPFDAAVKFIGEGITEE